MKSFFMKFINEIWLFAGWLIIFALIYWLATDNLWLCFFMTLSIMGSYTINLKKEILEFILPLHKNIDSNINALYETREQNEIEVDELKNELRKVKLKVEEIENFYNQYTKRVV